MRVHPVVSGVAGVALSMLVGCQASKAPEAAGAPMRMGTFTMTIDPNAIRAQSGVHASWVGQVPVVADGLATNPAKSIELWADQAWATGGISGACIDPLIAVTDQQEIQVQVNSRGFATEELQTWVVFTSMTKVHKPCWDSVWDNELSPLFPSSPIIDQGIIGGSIDPRVAVTTDYTVWSFDYNDSTPFTVTGQLWARPKPQPPQSLTRNGATVTSVLGMITPFDYTGQVFQFCPTASPCGTVWGGTPEAEVVITALPSWDNTIGNYYSAAIPGTLSAGTHYVFAFNKFMSVYAPTTEVRGVFSPTPLQITVP